MASDFSISDGISTGHMPRSLLESMQDCLRRAISWPLAGHLATPSSTLLQHALQIKLDAAEENDTEMVIFHLDNLFQGPLLNE